MLASERVERAIAAAERDPHNAYVTILADRARERARRLDALPESARGPLHGAIATVKDNLALAGARMTCGSKHLERYVAPYTATAVARLEAAGAVVIGKTNLDEFGCGSSGENSAFGPTRNPRDPARVPGGSSSGAAASVASGDAEIALGSDTGGSIRAPAAFCGLAALKPSRGLVSRFGLADMAMSLESPAPLAASVRDVARLLAAIAGPDPRDAVTLHARVDDCVAAVDRATPEGLRVGVVREFMDGLAPDVERACRAAIGKLAEAGALVDEVSVPSVKDALATYYLVCYGEFASALQKLDGFRYGTPGDGSTAEEAATMARASLGPEVKRRILLGTFVTSREERARWFDAADASRARLAAEFARALDGRDALVGATMPFTAFRLGERVADPLQLYASDVLTVSANLAGVPAGTVPLATPGLPIGLQVLGARGADATVLATMRALEALAGVRS